jgi:GNAT superfamily N-acetyltransferase
LVFEPINLNRRQGGPPAHQETGPGEATAYRYHNDYREAAHLPSGLNVIFRTIHPEDKQMLVDGMVRLSQESRQARFLIEKTSLSEPELRYLTELDGHNHLAIGVARPLPGGREDGIGIARFVRLNEDPQVAEPAITVIDEYQGRGVGTALLRRLVEAARERGIRRFRCDFLTDNRRVASIIDDLEGGTVIHRERGVVTMEFPLPLPRPDEHPRVTLKRSSMYRALSHVAQGLMSLRRVHHRTGTWNRIPSAGEATVVIPEPDSSREAGSLADSGNCLSSAKPDEEADA